MIIITDEALQKSMFHQKSFFFICFSQFLYRYDDFNLKSNK